MKAADKEIIAAIKAMGRLVDNQTFTHSYPFCWRSETPLIYRVGSTPCHPVLLVLCCMLRDICCMLHNSCCTCHNSCSMIYLVLLGALCKVKAC